MLKGLFGSRNVERILLFLFVNEKCYGTQIQSLFQVPLTPIQKALLRLEKEGVIGSHYEGKTRIYQFNASFPFRAELEMLLKKAYTLLSSQEKKHYCFIHKPRLEFKAEGEREQNCRNELLAFWKKLGQIQQLSFSVKSRHGEEQSIKVGKAEVVVTSLAPTTIVFQEKGHWFLDQVAHTAFSNSFRWTLDLKASLITLEHLRLSAARPVFLFHFTSTKPGMLESVDAHLCAEDTYLGNVVWNPKSIDFYWRIIGPHKNDHLIYRYT